MLDVQIDALEQREHGDDIGKVRLAVDILVAELMEGLMLVAELDSPDG